MVCRMVGDHKSNLHLTLFSALWAYRALVKKTTGFMSFQLVYRLEVVLPIECDIPSLNLVFELVPNIYIEEECFLYLTNLDKNR